MDPSAAIRQCYDRWFEAAVAGNARPFGELLADDFCYVDIFGVVRDGAMYRALVAEVPGGSVVMTLGEVEAASLGPLVRALGDYTVKGHLADGKDISSHTRFTSIWSASAGAWRCHSHHATTIA